MEFGKVLVMVLLVALLGSMIVLVVVRLNSKHGKQRDESKEASVKAQANQKLSFEDKCQIKFPDPYLPPKDIEIKKGTVFISVASYRDDECKNTLEQIFSKAASPDRVFVGVVQQNKDGEEEEDCMLKCKSCAQYLSSGNIRVANFPHTAARGPTWARFEATKLWKGEEYFMMIDSHTNFLDKWDETLFRELQATGDANAVLGGYPGTEEQVKGFQEKGGDSTILMCSGHFNDKGVPVMGGNIVSNESKKPVKMYFTGANFMAIPARALQKVPFDPYLAYLFMGEEILYSARLWTSGFNIYAPSTPFVTHHFGRKDKPKFWDDKGSDFHTCETKAVSRAKYLMGRDTIDEVAEDYRKDLDQYGLGKERSAEEYWKLAGIDWENQQFHNTCDKLK